MGKLFSPLISRSCSSACTVEVGWTCDRIDATLGYTYCIEICGDGVDHHFWECDDGNKVSGDGCDSTCHKEIGWSCVDDAALLTHCSPICGDGIVLDVEQCDDNNNLSGDGCSYSDCKIENGWYCVRVEPTLHYSSCETICGDGIQAGTEQCDLGDQNGVHGSTCSSLCELHLSAPPPVTTGTLAECQAFVKQFALTCNITATSPCANPLTAFDLFPSVTMTCKDCTFCKPPPPPPCGCNGGRLLEDGECEDEDYEDEDAEDHGRLLG